MTEQQATGWYPDPNDPNSEIYWDGTQWHGRREKFIEPAVTPTPAPPTPAPSPLGPNPKKYLISVVALLGGAVVFAVLFAWIASKLQGPPKPPVATYNYTTTTAPTTTTTALATPTTTKSPEPTDDEIAAAASKYIATYWLMSKDGVIRDATCIDENGPVEGPPGPSCWFKKVSKVTFGVKGIGFGATLRTLQLWMDDDLKTEYDQRRWGEQAADSVYNMIKDGSGEPDILIGADIESVEAVNASGNTVAVGRTPHRPVR